MNFEATKGNLPGEPAPEEMGPPIEAVLKPPKRTELIYRDYEILPDQASVDLVTDLGLMKPVDGAFRPDDRVCEAELLEILNKAAARMSDVSASLDRIPELMEVKAAFYAQKGFSRADCAKTIASALLKADGTGILPKLLYRQPIAPDTEELEFDNTFVFSDSCSAIENTGTSQLVFRNGRVIGTTTADAEPLKGPPAGLLVGGNLRTTLALKQAQAWYINSKIDAANWAGFSTDSGRPALEQGQKEQAVHVYGSSATVHDAGYGVYSDVFCNVFLYGTKLKAAEIGIISGTFGHFVTGSIADGEAYVPLAEKLKPEDMAKQPDKTRSTRVLAGRNAIMAHCVSLPPFWIYPGFSQEELPYNVAKAELKNTLLKTDMSLDGGLVYPKESAAYIRHHAGSLVLIKSCNVDFSFDNVQMEPDPTGTGALIHTAINSDIAFMVRVPDGETHPGQRITMKNMSVSGNILHEDYQRDLYLTLENTTLTGRVITGTVDTWNTLAVSEGFPSFAINPQGYQNVHGSHITLGAGSCWIVTGESTLNTLTVHETARICAVEKKTLHAEIDGAPVVLSAGIYRGSIRIWAD